MFYLMIYKEREAFLLFFVFDVYLAMQQNQWGNTSSSSLGPLVVSKRISDRRIATSRCVLWVFQYFMLLIHFIHNVN